MLECPIFTSVESLTAKDIISICSLITLFLSIIDKLEITPNSTQLIETKMAWAQQLLKGESAKVIWVVMPPISLQMYHESEGWNTNRM